DYYCSSYAGSNTVLF
nr:immunoglobulin light chain junction region [Macaca mulatta]MOW66143.1 immunoglobulin light chain junction region [Macaca mulatta]MOW66169.1 immunoglobulin light chain junction region [Macaca mulatta]MOW66184.1 immunoglobulin light chain junction region [Macaca mulatta]MOW66232.1 immunoglobulin light chain junction region [Macaca mulatta]